MANYHGILQGGTGSFSVIKLGDAGAGASAGTAFITSSAGGVDIANINKLTASYAKITELDVVTLNSVTTTQENLNVSASLIVASDGAAGADEADGSGLYISGAAASLTWDNGNSRLAVNKSFYGSAAAEFGGNVTAVGSFIIGSADLNEADMEKLDGITNGTVAASKAVVVDANKDASGFRNVTGTGAITAGTSFIIGSADLNEADMEKLDGITNGTAAASKAVVLDASKNIATIGTVGCGAITSTGASEFATVQVNSNAIKDSGGNSQFVFEEGVGFSAAKGTFSQGVYSTSLSGSTTLSVVGNTSLGGTISASGAADFDTVKVNGNLIKDSAGANQITFQAGVGFTAGGSATLLATTATTFSGSSTLQAVGATTLGSTLSVSGAATIEGAVSGAAGTFDALAGTSLALQSGGITAAGAIAGATTISSTGLVSGSGGLIGMGATTLGSTLALSGAATFGSYISASSYVSASSFSLGENSATIEYSDALDLSLGSTKYAALSTDYFSASVELQGPTVHTSGSVTAGTSFIIGSADLNEADLEKLDGITNGTVAASKAVVVDANSDASGFRNVTGTGAITAGTSFIIGSADLNEADMEKIDGITNGAGAANKALVLNASADIASGLRSITGSGDVKFANGHFDDLYVGANSFTIGSTELNESELSVLDSVTAGTVAASKVVVVDANKDIGSFRNVTLAKLSGSSTLQAVGATTLGSTLSVSGAATIEGAVSGAAGTFDALAGTSLALQSGGITAAGAIAGASTITSTGLVSGSGGLIGMGATTLGSTLNVSGTATMNAIKATTLSGSSTLQTVGSAILGSTLNVSGAATFASTGQFGGHVTPATDSTYNLGSTAKRWANIYTGDLHLKNERGNWTIFEEADHLRVRNNLTGKMFKMGLTPISED